MSTKEQKYIAELVRGEAYGLKERMFRPGEKHVVSESDVIHLEEHAVQVRSIIDHMDGSTIPDFVSMFSFAEFDGPEPVGHRFPTEEEIAAAAAVKASRARARRIALAKVEPPTRGDIEPARARSRTRAAA